MAIAFLRFLIRRSPLRLIDLIRAKISNGAGKKYSQVHPYQSAASSLLVIVFIFSSIVYILFSQFYQSAEADWWDDRWIYRKEIPITYTGSENLTEYQVLVDGLDTATMVTDGKLQSDCDDLRFTNANGHLLDYSIITTTCNTSDTEIWVKTDSIPATNVDIYMYYGNPSADASQSEKDTFSYSEEKTVGYVLDDSISSMQVISLEGDNSITHNSTTYSLNLGGTSTFSSLSNYGAISAKKLFNMSNTTASDLPVPVSWAGTDFVYRDRGSSYVTEFNLVSPWGTATVQIYLGGTQCGVDLTVTSVGTLVTNCNAADGQAFRITSDIPILAAKSSSGNDPHPMYPANIGPWYGWDSTVAQVAASSSPVDYRWIDSNDASSTDPADLSANATATISATGGSYYSGQTVKTWSVDNIFGASSYGDSDGGDSTTFVPRTEFGTRFGSAYNTDFVAVVSDQAATCTVYNSSGTAVETQTLASTSGEVYALPASTFGTGNSTTYITGAWWVDCDKPAYVVHQYSADEQNAWSYPMMRQYTYPAPAVGSLGTEEFGPGPIGYWSFDEGFGTTAQDETTQGNDGTITGATWQDESMCVSGKCMYFDGTDDDINMGNGSKLDFTGDFSISTWIKPTNLHSGLWFGMSNVIIFRGQDAASTVNYMLHLQDSTTIRFTKRKTAEDLQHYDYTSPDVLNQWGHLAAVYSSGSLELFYNGVSLGSQSITGGLESMTENFHIGRLGTATDSNLWFQGFIDETKVYPYARSDDQVKQDYNSGLAGIKSQKGVSIGSGSESDQWMTEGLVGYWKMDEANWNGTADEVVDSSGTGNHGYGLNSATTAAAKFGQGGKFNGTNQYVQVAHDTSIDLNDTVSMAFWYKDDGTSSTYTGVFRKTNTSAAGYYVTTNPTYEIYIRIDTSAGSNQSVGKIAGAMDGNWHHIAWVLDSGSRKGYLDGELVVDNIYNHGTGLSTTNPMYISGNNNVSTMDDARLYNRVLSDREIKKLAEWGPGPVMHLKSDEKTGTEAYDSSGSGNDGTLGGDGLGTDLPSWDEGKYGGGLNFDGTDDYVEVSSDPALELSGDLTVSGWFFVDSLTGQTVYRILGKGSDLGSTPDEYSIIVCTVWAGCSGDIDKLQFRVKNTALTEFTANSDSVISENKWYHFAGVLRGTTVELWVDGVKQTETATLTGTPNTASTTLEIGEDTANSDGAFDGIIDDVRIYNYALTSKQIVENMNGGHPAGGSPVGSAVGHWKFDGGYGSTAHDSGFGDNDGTLTPGASGTNTTATAMWDNNGKFGKAMEFDGTNDYVTIATPSHIDIDDTSDSQGTISFWMKPDWDSSTTTTTRIMTGVTGVGGDMFGLIFCGSDIYCTNMGLGSAGELIFLSMDGLSTQTKLAINTADYSWSTGDWVYVTMLWDDTLSTNDMRVFLNTVEPTHTHTSEGSLDLSAATLNYNDTMEIGASHGWGAYHDGLLDEFKIYNFALSKDEIALEYNLGKSLVLGQTGTDSSGVADSSASREYCVPGDSSTCNLPVGHWKMDEKVSGDAQTIYDISGNGNNGTTEWGAGASGMDCTRGGKYGSGCEFDGTDDYIGMNDSLSGEEVFSISVWFKTSSTNVAENRIYSEGGATGHYIYINVNENAVGDIEFGLRSGTGNGWGGCAYNGGYNDNVWHHVVAVNSSLTSREMYVDGSLVCSGTQNITAAPTVTSANIGSMAHEGLDHYFDGLIDEVRVYNYARTPAQIAWEYNQGGPVAEWRFDECSGATVHDETSNGNDGTVTIGGSGTQDALGTCSNGDSGDAWFNGATGKFGSAMSFDGTDDYIDIANDDSFNFGTNEDFTISAWVKSSYAAAASEWPVILAHEDRVTTRQGYSLNLHDSTADSRWFLSIYVSGAETKAFGASDIADGNWHHLVAVRKGSDLITYEDGKYASTTSGSSASLEKNIPLSIGRPSNYAGDNLDGMVDEVKIYNYAFTGQQVKRIYNDGAVNFR